MTMGILSALVLAASALSQLPAPQSTDPASSWVKGVARQRKIAKGGGAPVVLLGDEILGNVSEGGSGMPKPVFDKFWNSYPTVNFCMGLEKTENLLWRIEKGGILDGFEAKAIVLVIGVNNIGYRSVREEPPIDTIVGVMAVLKAVAAKQPKATVVLTAILPRGGKPDDPRRLRANIVNRELQKFADGRKVVWCDPSGFFLKPDGGISRALSPDALHFWEEGHYLLSSALIPVVNEILRADGLPIASRYFSPPALASLPDDPADALRPVSRFCQPGGRGPNWWGERVARNRRIVATRGDRIEHVFVGDSITHFWEDFGGEVYAGLTNRYAILNLGYGGDQTQNVLWRFRHGELEGYRAKTVTLMIGTNNNGIGGYNPENTAAGVKACLGEIAKRQPQAKIILMNYLPRAVGTKDGDIAKDSANARNLKTSALIRRFADGKRVLWLDIYDRFLENGRIRPKLMLNDFIHPSQEGYRVWSQALEPLLAED